MLVLVSGMSQYVTIPEDCGEITFYIKHTWYRCSAAIVPFQAGYISIGYKVPFFYTLIVLLSHMAHTYIAIKVHID